MTAKRFRYRPATTARLPTASRRSAAARRFRVGVVGTGLIARGFLWMSHHRNDLAVTKMLTRRSESSLADFPGRELLTWSLDEMLDHCDVVVECSGDVGHAARVAQQTLAAGLPLVTMNAEFQVTLGSYFVGQGLLTEAEGDQPGCLAALQEDALQMGFRPWVYGNLKGFLNHHPTLEEMQYWAWRQGMTLRQVTSFTDGTKLQIEQALVANGLDATLAAPGLLGPQATDLGQASRALAAVARRLGRPISDYVLSAGTFPGVFLVAEHDEVQWPYLRYLKMGDGPDYLLTRNFHLCHLEIAKTLCRVMTGGGVLLDNSSRPEVGVMAVAKRPLGPGTRVHRGIGSFDVRGVAVPFATLRDAVPIGLLEDVLITRELAPEQPVPWDGVEFSDQLAVQLWQKIADRCACEPALPVLHVPPDDAVLREGPDRGALRHAAG